MTIDLNLKQKNVLHIINKYPDAANNEPLLLAKYWQEIDRWDDNDSLYQNLLRMTRPETITRRRRELYNLGLIKYSDEADKKREEAFISERNHVAVSWL